MRRHDETFACMGTDVRVLVEDPVRDPAEAGAWARRHLHAAAAVLTRFEPSSELSLLNASPHPAVAASPLLRAAVSAALWAAAATDGLVDPTLLRDIRRAGYARSRTGMAPGPLADALAAAPAPTPARPDPGARWRSVRVSGDAIVRPPGLALDTGGTTKGLLADAVATRLERFAHYFVDCGGDLRIGGRAADPVAVLVEHPLTRERDDAIELRAGGIATSGLGNRVWRRRGGGGFAHHLIDPATGEPAWTGLIAVTAVAPTALAAEAIAKAALLSGPDGARGWLAAHGGRIVHADGACERIDPRPEPLRTAA